MAHPIPIENRTSLVAEAFQELARILSEQRSIKQALEWWLAQIPPLVPVDNIAQDEFSSDVIVPYRLDLYLSYDSG